MKRIKEVILLSFLAILFLSGVSFAGDTNFRSVIVGGRAFGLGGAFTAISDDSSGAFYNPAGVVYIEKSSFSLSGNIYTLQQRVTGDAFSHIDYQVKDAESSEIVPVPSTVATIKKMNKNFSAGFCAFVTDLNKTTISTNLTDDRNADDIRLNSLRRNYSDQTLLAGPVAAYKLMEDLSLGASIFIAMRSYSLSNTMSYHDYEAVDVANDDKLMISTADLFLTNFSILGQLGVRYTVVPDLHLGFAFKSRSFKVYSSQTINWTAVDETNEFLVRTDDENAQYGTYPYMELTSEGSKATSNNVLPYEFRWGIAYSRPHKYTVAADFMSYLGNDYNLVTMESGGNEIVFGSIKQKKFNYNVSVGGEYHIVKDVAVALGGYTNLSANSQANVDAFQNQDKIDYYGGNLGFTFYTKYASTNLGFGYMYGTGKTSRSFGEKGDNKQIRDISENHFGVMLAGSYHFD